RGRGVDVALLHPEHRLHRALRLLRVLVLEHLGEAAGDDLRGTRIGPGAPIRQPGPDSSGSLKPAAPVSRRPAKRRWKGADPSAMTLKSYQPWLARTGTRAVDVVPAATRSCCSGLP